jgi:hypothetical protein
MQTLSRRRAIANSIAARQGVPVDQTTIDARLASLAAKLNATLPSNRTPIGAGRTSPSAGSVNPTQGDIDATWALIVTKLNQEAGLPDRRAR